MKMTYSREVDALSIRLAAAERPRSREIAPGVVGDFDADGTLVGIEILDASERYSREELEALDTPGERMTLEAAAAFAAACQRSVTATTLRVQLRNGRLKGEKEGGVWFVKRSEMQRYVEATSGRGRPSPHKLEAGMRKPAKKATASAQPHRPGNKGK